MDARELAARMGVTAKSVHRRARIDEWPSRLETRGGRRVRVFDVEAIFPPVPARRAAGGVTTREGIDP